MRASPNPRSKTGSSRRRSSGPAGGKLRHGGLALGEVALHAGVRVVPELAAAHQVTHDAHARHVQHVGHLAREEGSRRLD